MIDYSCCCQEISVANFLQLEATLLSPTAHYAMFSGKGFGTFMEASRLLRFLFFVTDLKELSQLQTGGFDLLGL